MRRETTHGQTHDDMWMSALLCKHVVRHLEPCKCMCARMKCVNVRENALCEGVLFTHTPVGYSGSLSTVNETNCNKKKRDSSKKKCELTSNSIRMRNNHEELGDEGQYCHPVCWSTRALEQ